MTVYSRVTVTQELTIWETNIVCVNDCSDTIDEQAGIDSNLACILTEICLFK